MTWLLLREQPLGVPGEFEYLHPLDHVGLFGSLVVVDCSLQPELLLAPFAGEGVVKVAANLAVELVDIHGIDAVAQTLVLGPEPFNHSLMLAALICVAGL